jgi:6-phosphofructokinase 1
MNKIKRIAVLSSGGDSPGMNAAIRAIVKSGLSNGIAVYGIEQGFKGLIENNIRKLGYKDVNNIIQSGGTILGTARCEEFREKNGRLKAQYALQQHQIDGLIVIGGDGSFAGANLLFEEFGVPIIGIPATIDNDIQGTDYSIGYDTCLNTVIDAVDKIRDTASSHRRVFFIEVMGKTSGCIALNSAIASGAESVLIPETITDISVLAKEIATQNKGVRSSIIIVAEGDDAGGAKEIVEKISPLLPDFELRYSILGHIQRGGRPSAFDRILATSMGVKAVELLMDHQTGLMIGIQNNQLITQQINQGTTAHVPIDEKGLHLLKALLTQVE